MREGKLREKATNFGNLQRGHFSKEVENSDGKG